MGGGWWGPRLPSAVPETLHMVEPNLRSHDGHCASLVECMVHACRPAFPEIVVWGAKEGTLESIEGARLERHFARATRRVALLTLLIRLLRQDCTILLPTANATDLSILALAQSLVPRPRARVAAFVHYYSTHKRARARRFLMRWAAGRPRPPRLLAPMPVTADRLRAAGFRDVHVIAYPRHWGPTPPIATEPPRLLVPGGVREDKGFEHVVEYVEFLHAHRSNIPIDIQVTATASHGSLSTTLAQGVQRLKASGYPHLRLIERAPGQEQYMEMFRGSVVLQPYDPAIFATQISGVTLDAFAAGAPAIVTEGMWSAGEVARTGAGVVVHARDPKSIHDAVTGIFAAIQRFRQAACAASDLKRSEQDSPPIAQVLADA